MLLLLFFCIYENLYLFKGSWSLLWIQVAQKATMLTWVQCAKVNLPRNIKQPFPYPNDATNKIWSRLTNWLQRYSSSKVWHFRHSRASNSKMSGLIRPKIELNRAFMPVLLPATLMMIWSKMIKLAWRQHFPIISLREFFRRSRAANSIVSGPIWPKSELVRDFMHVLITCKYKKNRTKSSREKVETPFSHL